MDRETASNVLIGGLLLSVLILGFAAVGGAAWFALYAVEIGVKHFLPALGRHWDLAFYGALAVGTFSAGLVDLWKKRWRNAFLSLALVPMLFSIPLAAIRTAVRSDGPFPVWPALLIFVVQHVPLSRLEFFAGALTVAGCIALNAGLLGAGAAAHYLAFCIPIGSLAWLVIYVRHERFARTDASALFPTRT